MLASVSMAVGMAVGMTWLAEPELERQLLPRVAVQVETESVQALISECIGCGQSRIGVHRHGHNGRASGPIEQIKIVYANARVFSGGWSIKVMGHGTRFLLDRDSKMPETRPASKDWGRKTLVAKRR